jgi:hypothetical protein
MIAGSIRVTAQYRENYGDINTPYWKMKGGKEFVFNNVDDSVMYAGKNEVSNIISKMLTERSNDMFSYELIEWDWVFGEPTVLSTEDLMKGIVELYK